MQQTAPYVRVAMAGVWCGFGVRVGSLNEKPFPVVSMMSGEQGPLHFGAIRERPST